MEIEFRLNVRIDRDAYNAEYGDDSESNDEVVDYIKDSILGRISELSDTFDYYRSMVLVVTKSPK